MEFPLPFRALTVTAIGGRLRVISTVCHASAAFDPTQTSQGQQPQYHEFSAIWDTGATASVITQDVITACGLKPTGMTRVHGVGGEQDAETFLINIRLPNDVAFGNVQVTRGRIREAQVLIGMDIITWGDLSLTNLNGKTVFSFRVPSIAAVDFVKEANELVAKAAKQKERAGKRHRKKRRKRKPWS